MRNNHFLVLVVTLLAAFVGCQQAMEPGRQGQKQTALEFVCPEGCTCICSGGSGEAGAPSSAGAEAGGAPASAGGASGGSPAATCDLSAYTVGVWRATVGQPPLGSSDIGQGIAIDPNNPGTVYVTVLDGSTGGLWRSTDCGATWSEVGDFGSALQIRINPQNSDELYVGCGVGSNNGFFYSDDAGATWAQRDFPSETIQRYNDVYHIAVNPTDFSHALVSFHYPGNNQYNAAGIAETFDKGATWTEHQPISGWSGQAGTAVDFLYDPASSQGNAATWLYTTQNAGMWRTTNSGSTWTQVSGSNQSHGGNQIYYASDGILYSGAAYHPVKSTDNGASWSDLSNTSYGYFIGFGGDGTNLYTSKWAPGSSATMNISTESSEGSSWNTNGPEIDGGTYEFTAVDAVNHIMYASAWNSTAIWAVKTQ